MTLLHSAFKRVFYAYHMAFRPRNLHLTACASAQSSWSRARKNRVQTLQPHLGFQPSDFVNVSGQLYPAVNIDGENVRIIYCAKISNPATETMRRVPFPPNTHGFLYYHPYPHNIPGSRSIPGEVRFRVTPPDDRHNFNRGTDLVTTYKDRPVTWSLPVNTLVRASHAPLMALLRKEGIVDDWVMPPQAMATQRACRFGRQLHYLEQPFEVDLRMGFTLRVVTERASARVIAQGFFTDKRLTINSNPFNGRLLLRFERSTLPEHKGTSTVVLRVLKIIEPITLAIPAYDKYLPFPKEGELFVKRQRAGHHPLAIFSANLDKPSKFKALKLLWDVNDTTSRKPDA